MKSEEQGAWVKDLSLLLTQNGDLESLVTLLLYIIGILLGVNLVMLIYIVIDVSGDINFTSILTGIWDWVTKTVTAITNFINSVNWLLIFGIISVLVVMMASISGVIALFVIFWEDVYSIFANFGEYEAITDKSTICMSLSSFDSDISINGNLISSAADHSHQLNHNHLIMSPPTPS